ncbi:hypothetical protein HDU91_004012 [Kappamyces sp. JEL0680]|nr:hypothetical protein HDU91_004012 [Kappamyces sp. JEL0680]
MLRMVCEADSLATAQAILDAENITCATGRLVDGVYDAQGNHYVIPDYCIGVLELPDDAEEKSLLNASGAVERAPSFTLEQLEEAGFSITCRLSSGTDVALKVAPDLSIASMKQLIASRQGYTAAQTEKVRIILLGKVLDGRDRVRDTKICENSIVQVFI